jgi:hypothetical protein
MIILVGMIKFPVYKSTQRVKSKAGKSYFFIIFEDKH